MELKFVNFLKQIEENSFETNTTANGNIIIQQTLRNKLRQEGVAALKEDLTNLYGNWFDVVETKEGIVIVAENDDFTFSWEVKNTIKSLDYDPFIEANRFEEEKADKANKKAARENEKQMRQKALELKRAKKLAELEKQQSLIK